MHLSFVYLLKAILFALVAFTIIPKEKYKKFILYGFFFGYIMNIILVLLLTALNQLQYTHLGYFSVFGYFSIWTPIAWMFAFSLFFYLLPIRKIFLYPYIFVFGLTSSMVGHILEQIGVYTTIGIYKYIAPVLFIAWYAVSAHVFYSQEKIKLE